MKISLFKLGEKHFHSMICTDARLWLSKVFGNSAAISSWFRQQYLSPVHICCVLISPFFHVQVKQLKGSHRIEVHVYAPDWITLVAECAGEEQQEEMAGGIEPDSLTTMATQLLIMISKHVQTLASDWFSGMLNTFVLTSVTFQLQWNLR